MPAVTGLLLHYNSTITDEAEHALTTAGGVAIAASPAMFGGGALQVNSTAKYVSMPGGGHLNATSGESYTFEFFLYRTTDASYGEVCDFGVDHLRIYVDNSGRLVTRRNNAVLFSGPATTDSENRCAITANTWHHVAIVQDAESGYIAVFINGHRPYRTSVLRAINSATPSYVAGSATPIGSLNGYIDEMRFVNGIAAYPVGVSAPAYDVYTVPASEFPAPSKTGTTIGFNTTAFGTPIFATPGIPVGFSNTVFGQPHAMYNQIFSGVTAGVLSSFGTPTGNQSYVARETTAWQYGSIDSTAFGTPTMRRPNVVAGFNRTAFGTPQAIANQYSGIVPGFNATAFGQPSAAQQNTFAVGVFNPSTLFGTPACTFRQTGVVTGFSRSAFGYPHCPRDFAYYDSISVLTKPRNFTVFGKGLS